MPASKKKQSGHYCRVCGVTKPNEQFGGKGHAAHICKQCAALPLEQRAEELVLRRIGGMAHRYINDKERQWLSTKCSDPNLMIKEAAQAVFAEKFPRVVRNHAKKSTVITALDLYIHGEAYDMYGEPMDVHGRFLADSTGRLRHIDYAADGAEREVAVHRHEMQKFFIMLVHEWNAPFWQDDLSDADYAFDPDIDVLPVFDDEDDTPDDDGEIDMPVMPPAEEQEPLWSLTLTLRSGEERRIVFYHQMHTEAVELYLEFCECLLIEDNAIDDEDAPLA